MKCVVYMVALGFALPAGCVRPVLVIAHRGMPSAYPENTMPSFRAAIEADADWVELDSRLSADGTAFCLHDETLDRTTDARVVVGREEVRLAEAEDSVVGELDAGTWFDRRFAQVPVPRLDVALDVIQEESTTLLERKDGSAEFYAGLLRDKGLVGRMVVQSFDWKFLQELHGLLPDQPLCALGSKGLDEARWRELRRTGAAYVAWAYQDLNRSRIAQFHDKGLHVFAYTVNEEDDWRRMVRDGVDGIITNHPGALRRWMGGRRVDDRFRIGSEVDKG